jgi:hypothetical protein
LNLSRRRILLLFDSVPRGQGHFAQAGVLNHKFNVFFVNCWSILLPRGTFFKKAE